MELIGQQPNQLVEQADLSDSLCVLQDIKVCGCQNQPSAVHTFSIRVCKQCAIHESIWRWLVECSRRLCCEGQSDSGSSV